MRVWGKLETGASARGVARAILAGASRQEWVTEAVRALLLERSADRVGVWTEANEEMGGPTQASTSFRGLVADLDGTETPGEWSRISPAGQLPRELLNSMKSVEHDLIDSPKHAVIGALVEMRRVLWVPIETGGHLRGVILAGTRKRHAVLPRNLAEAVAAELALALELEGERRLSRERQQDFLSVRSALSSVGGSDFPEKILQVLVEECVGNGKSGLGLGSVFAMVGQCAPRNGGDRAEPGAAEAGKQERESVSGGEMQFRWCSGDAAWIRAAASEPLSLVWRRALETQRMVGIEPAGVWSHREVARFVAFPLRGGGDDLGVLVVGMRRGTASLGMLERLELRAALAASALLHQTQAAKAILQEARHKTAMESSAAAARTEALRPGADEMRQRAHTELVNVIEWLEEGVVLFGVHNEIRAMNARFGQIVGLTPEESVEVKTLDALVERLASKAADPGSFAERWRHWARALEGAGREELQLVRPVPRLLERAARPILDEKGELLGRVEIYRDLTAQRMFQSKLLQTEKLAELGQMVTGIAHELSNPLTSILGYAQRLLLRSGGTGQAHEARQILEEAERASAILRQLLSTARESRPERRRVALNQVVSRTMELQRFSLAAEKVRLELDLEPVLPFVQGDSGQLQQVLMNLIGNARQAIEEQGGGGTIRVRTKRIAERHVLLEVNDSGPGIPQSIQARIFDPFFTTKPVGVGTGLGLAIALGIVREHGGQLHVTSPPGGGATFSVELPAIAAGEIPGPVSLPRPGRKAQKERSRAEEVPVSETTGGLLAPWAGLRVVVVEDEPTVARLIGDVLEDEGLRVDVLFDGREALRRVTQENYDLVICDMKMPELDGEHFYQTLAQAGNPVHGRFLFVTGDVLAVHTREFLEHNHLPHVAKPFRVEELTEKIRSVLAQIRPREATGTSAARSNSAR